MSGRFVRASKYRHVHGEPARKDKCFTNIRPQCNGDANFIKGNTKFLAFAMSGGGGPLVIHPRDQSTRLEHSPLVVNVHTKDVLDFDFNPFVENVIATCSEDGLVKVTMFPEDGLKENVENASANLEGHAKKVAFVHWHPTANNILGSAGYDNAVLVWDVEKQARVCSFDKHDGQIQSFEFNANGSRIATTCKDKFVRIYDPRDSEAVQSTTGFGGAKPSKCVWMENHNLLCAVGFSPTSQRQYMLWDPRKFDKPATTSELDTSAGVLIPFYDEDTSVLFLGGKGDGNIRYFECVDDAPYLHYLAEFRSNESQKGLAYLPKRACDVSVCEIAHCLRLMRDYICPVSFQVPRKSEIFQSDIYPDTYAGVPSLTADEWLEGKDRDPIKVSMKPGAAGGDEESKKAAPGGVKATFVPKKTVADLQKELDEANARIAQLEALVQQLGGKLP